MGTKEKKQQAVKNLVAELTSSGSGNKSAVMKEATKPTKIRISTMIDKDLYSKVQIISKDTNISISKIIGKSLSNVVEKYEQKNGEIKKSEMREKDIEDFI